MNNATTNNSSSILVLTATKFYMPKLTSGLITVMLMDVHSARMLKKSPRKLTLEDDEPRGDVASAEHYWMTGKRDATISLDIMMRA